MNPNQKFAMPMFRPWVPERVRPWMYVVFAALFQLSGGVYFANLQHMMGATSLMREDIQLVAMFGVVGVNMPFPSCSATSCASPTSSCSSMPHWS